jgi:hypothetical protein
MSHVLTSKIPHSLLYRLEEASTQQGKSKGALVREALEMLLRTGSSPREQIRNVTELLLKKKKPRIKVDWNELRKKAAVSTGLSPEEEVLKFRRRRL